MFGKNIPCVHCNSTETVKLASVDQVICCECKKYTKWELKPKQKAPLEDRKVGK